MHDNLEDGLYRFLGELVEDQASGRTQVRITRAKLLSLIRLFQKRNRTTSPADEILESWAQSLVKSVFYKNYLIKYVPAVDALSFQWVPPWEGIKWAAEIRKENLRRDVRESIEGLSFDAFEHLMRQVFLRVSWARDIVVTKISYDDGIDFEGKFFERSSELLLPLVGQAKHWKSRVGSEEIRTFLGSIAVRRDHLTTVGVYVSTNGFTDGGLSMIRKSPNHIIWYDTYKLADLMISNRVGVSAVSVKGMGLDSGFWNDLQS